LISSGVVIAFQTSSMGAPIVIELLPPSSFIAPTSSMAVCLHADTQPRLGARQRRPCVVSPTTPRGS
jgi:hypothetical protein